MGKRGNIVQTYPAMEYRFFPEVLHATTDDVVCFVWSGENIIFINMAESPEVVSVLTEVMLVVVEVIAIVAVVLGLF